MQMYFCIYFTLNFSIIQTNFKYKISNIDLYVINILKLSNSQ